MKTIKVKTVDDFVHETRSLLRYKWAFRGHADANWLLESTLSRFYRTYSVDIRQEWQASREAQAVRKFQRSAHHFLTHLPKDDDTLDWLAVMRHYGAPTRLIDFTYSPITALFFAFGDQFRNMDKEPVVHAVHIPSVLTTTLATLESKQSNQAKMLVRIGRGEFRIGADQSDKHYLGFFEGRWQTPRQTAQQGLFMVTSRLDTKVDEVLAGVSGTPPTKTEQPWLRFQFPKGRRMHKSITKYLLDLDQTNARFYPGIEGLAQSLCMRLHEPKSAVERRWAEE